MYQNNSLIGCYLNNNDCNFVALLVESISIV